MKIDAFALTAVEDRGSSAFMDIFGNALENPSLRALWLRPPAFDELRPITEVAPIPTRIPTKGLKK